MRRYSITCHDCDGRGNVEEFPDDDGNRVLGRCQCYRGKITICLTPEDERKLISEIQTALNTEKS